MLFGLRTPDEQRNTDGFNYQSFLVRRNIFGILHPQEDIEIRLTPQSKLIFSRWTEQLRQQTETIIDQAYSGIPDLIVLC